MNADKLDRVYPSPARCLVLISLDKGDSLDDIRSASGSRFQIISLSDFPRMSRDFINRSLKKG